ncbi:MAG: Calx-beta domain-containing protein [Bacillota bacterium]|nr:Calx-beta domain-containing protein [Bacillota bacterium]
MMTRFAIPMGKIRSVSKRACIVLVIIALLVFNLTLPTEAAITIGSNSSTTATSGTGLTVTLDKPAGTVAGDVLVACIMATSAIARRAEVTPPADWQLIRHTYATQGWYYEMLTYYKVAGTSEPANYIWTSTEFNLSGGMTRLIGVDVNHVVDVSAEAQGQGDSPATATAPSVTTTYANDIVISFFGTYEPLASPYFYVPLIAQIEPLYAYAPQKTGAFAPPNVAAYHYTKAVKGDTSPKSCFLTATTSPIRWVAQTVAFKAAPRAYFPVASGSAAEANSSHWVGVNLAPNAEGPVEVNFTVSGTAQPGVDYTLITTSPLTVNTGSGSASIGINIIEDNLYEADETIIITLVNGQEYFLSGSTQYVYTITNDDVIAPTPVIATGASRTSVTPTDISLQVLQIPNPSAVAGELLLAAITRQGSSWSQTIIPPEGWTLIRETHYSNSQGLNLATYYKIAGLSEPSVYTWGIPDDHSVIGYHASGGITRYTGVDVIQPIDVSNAATGTMPAGTSGTVTVPSVYPSYTNSHIISAVGIYNPVTNIVAPAGMIEQYEIKHSIAPYNSMTLLWPTTQMSDMIWTPATGTGVKTTTVQRFLTSENTDWVAQTIALKTSRLSISDVSIAEGNNSSANVTVTVSLDHPTNVPVTFNWLTADGTAIAHEPNLTGDDYMVSGGSNYVIPAGQTSYDLVIPIIGDTTLESNETFYVNLTNVTGATVADSQAMVTILDNDSSITINDISQNEGNSGTSNFNFTVTLNPACSLPVSITYFTPSEGTATQSVDYTYTPGTVEFAAGQTSKTISIPVVGDTDFEANETFVVYLSSATNAKITDNRGTGTILNDDVQIPTVSINDVSLAEGNSGTSNMVFTVTLNVASASAVTVNYTTANGTAAAASDYTATSGTLTIPAGQKSGTITVPIIGDTAFEPNETFYVNLSSPANATLSDNQGLGTINNDDVIHASINDVTQAEGSSGSNAFVFTVTLDSASSSTVTIDFATADGTAFAGPDYSGYAAETLTFSPGVTSKTITVQVSGDTTYESDETFYINLSNASGAVISDAQGVGTILNDDAMPTYALTMAVSPAGSGTATDQVGASPYTAGTLVTINATPAAGYHFVNWTAPAGSFSDANAVSTTFTMPAQEVTVTANFALDTFTVTFNSQGGSAVSDQIVSSGSLVDRPVDPVRSGYVFAGWYKEAACTDDWDFAADTVTASTTLYARWAVLDQYTNATTVATNAANGTYAQTFTAGITGKLYKVSVYLNNYITNLTLTTQIQGATAGDVPDGTVLASRTISMSVSSARWVDVILPEPIAITAGQRYAIVWSGLDGDDLLYGCTTDACPGGRALMVTFSSWSMPASFMDFCFRTYVLTSPGITLTPAEGLETTETGGTDTFTVVLDSQPAADVTVTLSSSESGRTPVIN